MYQEIVSFDLGDVGEFINDNPQIPLAAGLVAGQAVRRNVERARRDAAELKKSLEVIQKQNEAANRLALDKENRERKLSDDRETLFRLTQSATKLLERGFSLPGYLELESLASEFASKKFSSASFQDYQDKEMLVSLQATIDDGRRGFSASITTEMSELISNIGRWDRLVQCLQQLVGSIREHDRVSSEELLLQKRIQEASAPVSFTFADAAKVPSIVVLFLLAPASLVGLLMLRFTYASPNSDASNPFLVFIAISIIPLFCLGSALNEFFTRRKRLLVSHQEKLNALKSEWVNLSKRREEVEGRIENECIFLRAIEGIDDDTIEYAASQSISASERNRFLESCEGYLQGLLASGGISTTHLPAIRGLRAIQLFS